MSRAEGLSRWWQPHVHADRRPLLLARGRLKTALRAWFQDRGFIEVETSALQVSPGNEAHLHAFATTWQSPSGEDRRLYMHTSPEFACKKLLAAGETAIFTFAPVFRNRELGALHQPEFTMLEWYRVGAPYEALMDDCAALLCLAADVTGSDLWSFRGRVTDPRALPIRRSVAELFGERAGIDLLATLDGNGRRGDRDRLAAQLHTAGIAAGEDESWSDLFSRALVTSVEPGLGSPAPVILDRYPRVEAALARPAPDDPRVAQRFELYVAGIELANGFGELTDPVEQRLRFVAEMDEKERRYGERYPIDDDFLSALAAMPAAAGIALGFDRLVMLAAGAERIEQVMWTPMEADT